jgi:hypothetical protein
MRGGKSPSGEDAGGEGVRQILILVRSWVHGKARSSGHMELKALCYIGPYGKKVAARSFAHAHQPFRHLGCPVCPPAPHLSRRVVRLLVDYLVASREVAWDCAKGNGQAATHLARYFERVIATDESAEMLAQLGGGDHTVFVGGDDAEAKATVKDLLQSFGWSDILDLGDITTARGTEMMLPVWVRLFGALQKPLFNFKIVR